MHAGCLNKMHNYCNQYYTQYNSINDKIIMTYCIHLRYALKYNIDRFSEFKANKMFIGITFTVACLRCGRLAMN